ncbi:hypothetical protein E2C01_024851 [Portunus trituberculatus]|uniref:Uncharacterized protein n=1 Tax=Portunus trituberculatus TaxID=210409 RepID=A0A5B7EE12_PORTR|nr:hypothetical protein [Portunus trituberculatus]
MLPLVKQETLRARTVWPATVMTLCEEKGKESFPRSSDVSSCKRVRLWRPCTDSSDMSSV